MALRVDAAAAEADECYTLGPLAPDGMPDVAIEVTAPSEIKLLTYARLGVREVWQWSPERVVVRELRDGQYRGNAWMINPESCLTWTSCSSRPS